MSAESIPAIGDELTGLLRDRHRLVPGQPDDFNIRKPEDVIKAQEEMARTLTSLLAVTVAVEVELSLERSGSPVAELTVAVLEMLPVAGPACIPCGGANIQGGPALSPGS